MQYGVCECFFGPTWSEQDRESWADFLNSIELDFYLYGPKADPFLRKQWLNRWSSDYLQSLKKITTNTAKNKINSGVALSPYGLLTLNDSNIKNTFVDKIKILEETGFNFIGLFFDDLNYFDGLIDLQLEAVEIAKKNTSLDILFCPSYYSYDPILDKVFGQRPENYVERIGAELSTNVNICWTGPKVISSEITDEHLIEVAKILNRKPFLFDNHFANDGPKNCKYLKLKNYSGRSENFTQLISGLTLNPMNQSYLSQIMVASTVLVLKHNVPPNIAFETSVKNYCSKNLSEILFKNRDLFMNVGLDKFEPSLVTSLIESLNNLNEPASKEVLNWLLGQYNVGTECLTD